MPVKAFGSILVHSGAFWSIVEHFGAFCSILEHCGASIVESIREQSGAFWSIREFTIGLVYGCDEVSCDFLRVHLTREGGAGDGHVRAGSG